MKKVLALILALVMVFALAACGGETEPTPTQNPSSGTETQNPGTSTPEQSEEPQFEGVREVSVGVKADIKTWEPWGSFNIGRQNMAPIVYQALTCHIPNLVTGEMEEYFILAESYERIEEGYYRIRLREGIKDTNGYDFTADDAIFSFQTCIDLGVLAQVKPIAEMTKEDDLTFTMKLKRDTVGTFSDICDAINMVTQRSYEESPDKMATTPVGTSPMILSEYRTGSEAVFTKADSYWNAAANESKDVSAGYCTMWDYTAIDKITYKFISDTTAMALALESGEIDIARAISDEDVSLYDGNGYAVFGYPEGNYAVSFNVSSNSPFQSYNLRMAVAYAIDSEGCLMAACDGDGEVATCWSYKTFTDYLDEWTGREYFNYNMDTAKDYLAKWEEETGKKASDLHLVLMYQNEDIADSTAVAIQNYVGTLTGNPNAVELVSYDRATFTASKKDPAASDMVIVNGQLVTRSESCYNWNDVSNTKNNGFNIFHDDTGAIDEVLMPAITIDTHNADTVRAFQQFIDDNCYLKNLFYANEYGACADWIGNTEHATGAKSCLNLGALTYDWAQSGK